MEALKSVHKEIHTIVSERRVQNALNSSPPPAADRIRNMGKESLLYSGKEEKCMRLNIVVDCTAQMITINNSSSF